MQDLASSTREYCTSMVGVGLLADSKPIPHKPHNYMYIYHYMYKHPPNKGYILSVKVVIHPFTCHVRTCI